MDLYVKKIKLKKDGSWIDIYILCVGRYIGEYIEKMVRED